VTFSEVVAVRDCGNRSTDHRERLEKLDIREASPIRRLDVFRGALRITPVVLG